MTEQLNIQEEDLEEVIEVIRLGLKELGKSISSRTRKNLTNWCDEMEEYINED